MQPQAQKTKDSAGFDVLAILYPYLPYLPWIALWTCLFVVKAIIFLASSPTLYEATTLLKLSETTKPVSTMASTAEGQAGSTPDIILATYVEEARSGAVASRTAATLDVSSVASLAKLNKKVLADLLAKRVSVRNYRATSLIEIDALGESPQLASDLANGWAEAFIDEDLAIVHSGAAELHRFLDEQSAQVQDQMQKSQEQLKAISGKNGGNMMEQNLDAQLGSLDQRILQLQQEQSNLESIYEPGHPLVKSHLAELEQAIQDRDRLQERSGNSAWIQSVHEIKALENTSDWLMEKEQENLVSENMSASNILVVDPASPPYNASYPKRRETLEKAILMGLVSGLGLVWFFLFVTRKVQRGEDLSEATGAALLGLIPDFQLEERLVAPPVYAPGWMTRFGLRQSLQPFRALYYDLKRRCLSAIGRLKSNPAPSLFDDASHQGTYFRECFNEIRNRLLLHPVSQKPACLAIFTPGYQEGRSTANAGLALALARAGKKVLLIDANPLNPSLAPLFGLSTPSKGGLAEFLATATGPAPEPVATPYPGLMLLPSAKGLPLPSDWIASNLITEQFRLWKSKFDFIILDPSALDAFSGTQDLTKLTDGVIVMATSRRTRHSNLKVVMEILKSRQVPILSCILNRADIRYYSLPHHYFYDHSGLGRQVLDQAMAPRPAAALEVKS